MFILHANNVKLQIQVAERLTSGAVGVYRVQFSFDDAWDELSKTAVFRAGDKKRSVLLDNTLQCEIPWEVLTEGGYQMYIGVYGTQAGKTVLPTIWAYCGKIYEGVSPGEEAHPPTPELWEQELSSKGDTLGYTPAGELGLYARDKLLSAIPVAGGGESGVSDHRMLTNRSAAAQHPISSIDGLSDALERIPEPVEAITNDELEAILK